MDKKRTQTELARVPESIRQWRIPDPLWEKIEPFGYTAHIKARGEEAQALKHEVGFKARRFCGGADA